MIEAAAKARLRDDLRAIRTVLVEKAAGLSEYDARRPLTASGTNLLGLVKHVTLWESRYLGAVFGRPFPEPLPRWDSVEGNDGSLWLTEHETREATIARYERVWRHSRTTIDALPLDAPGRVPWWGHAEVTLLGVLLHLIGETSRHAGHADILREQLDGAVGDDPEPSTVDPTHGQDRWHRIEQAARAADAR